MAEIGRDIKEGEIIPLDIPDPTHVPDSPPVPEPIKTPEREPEKV